MRKIISVLSAAVLALTLTACGTSSKVDEEIQLPIYEAASLNFSTATAEIMDLNSTESSGASIGYLYADSLTNEVEGNLLEYLVTRNQEMKEGDIIARLDSAAADYDYNSQQIVVNNAYANYLASGSEKSRLTYEEEQKELDLIGYEVEKYTIRAPYDCIVIDTERYTVGDVVPAGSFIARVARPSEVFVYTDKSAEKFHFGQQVDMKINNFEFTGTVVSTPEDAPRDSFEEMSRYAVIALNDGELERLNSEVSNAVSAGWATVMVTNADKYNVLAVPDRAVNKYSSEIYCYLVENNEKVKIPVEVGDSYNGFTIIKNGLTAGDTVALS